MLDKNLLMSVQDQVFADPRWQPEADGITHCNQATLVVCQGIGCHAFDTPPGADPLLADQMYELMKSSDKFIQKPIADAEELAAEGVFIIAALPAEKLGQGEGHICTLTIGNGGYSGHWLKDVPSCMNIGRKGTCFRNGGVNYAFVPEPEFFAWRETL